MIRPSLLPDGDGISSDLPWQIPESRRRSVVFTLIRNLSLKFSTPGSLPCRLPSSYPITRTHPTKNSENET